VRICFDGLDDLRIDGSMTVPEIVRKTVLEREIILVRWGHVVLGLARDFVLRGLVLDDGFYDEMSGDDVDGAPQSRCHGVVFGVEREISRSLYDHFYDGDERIV